MWTMNFQMFKLDLEKAEEPEIKLPTSARSLKKQESSRKTSTSAFLTMPKPLTVWITAIYITRPEKSFSLFRLIHISCEWIFYTVPFGSQTVFNLATSCRKTMCHNQLFVRSINSTFSAWQHQFWSILRSVTTRVHCSQAINCYFKLRLITLSS